MTSAQPEALDLADDIKIEDEDLSATHIPHEDFPEGDSKFVEVPEEESHIKNTQVSEDSQPRITGFPRADSISNRSVLSDVGDLPDDSPAAVVTMDRSLMPAPPVPLERGLSKLSLGRVSFDSIDFGSEIESDEEEGTAGTSEQRASKQDLLGQLGVSASFLQKKAEHRQEQERLEREEQERLQKEEQERLQREEQERLEREEQERLQKEEQERLQREEQERLQREEQERLQREEQERLDREEQERLKSEQQKRESASESEKPKARNDAGGAGTVQTPSPSSASPAPASQSVPTSSGAPAGHGERTNDPAANANHQDVSEHDRSKSVHFTEQKRAASASGTPRQSRGSSTPHSAEKSNNRPSTSPKKQATEPQAAAGTPSQSRSRSPTSPTASSRKAPPVKKEKKEPEAPAPVSTTTEADAPKKPSRMTLIRSALKVSEQGPEKDGSCDEQSILQRFASVMADFRDRQDAEEPISSVRAGILNSLQLLVRQSAKSFMERYASFSATLAAKKKPLSPAVSADGQQPSCAASCPDTNGSDVSITPSPSSSATRASKVSEEDIIRRYESLRRESENSLTRLGDLELSLKSALSTHFLYLRRAHERVYAHAAGELSVRGYGPPSRDGREYSTQTRKEALKEEADRCVRIASRLQETDALCEAALKQAVQAGDVHDLELADVQFLLNRSYWVALHANSAVPKSYGMSSEAPQQAVAKLELYSNRLSQLRHRIEYMRSLEMTLSGIHEIEKEFEYDEVPYRQQSSMLMQTAAEAFSASRSFSPASTARPASRAASSARKPSETGGVTRSADSSGSLNGRSSSAMDVSDKNKSQGKNKLPAVSSAASPSASGSQSPAHQKEPPPDTNPSLRRRQVKADSTQRESLVAHMGMVNKIAFASMNPRKAASSGTDFKVRVYYTNGDGKDPQPIRDLFLDGRKESQVRYETPSAIQFHPLTADVLAVLYQQMASARIALWNVTASYGEQLSSLRKPSLVIDLDHPVNCFSFTSDGSCIVYGSSRSLFVYDLNARAQLKMLESVHGTRLSCIAPHPLDGSLVATASDDGEVKVHDIGTWSVQFRSRVSRNFTGIASLAFTKSGEEIVCATVDGAVVGFRCSGGGGNTARSSSNSTTGSTQMASGPPIFRMESYPQRSPCTSVAADLFKMEPPCSIIAAYQNATVCMYMLDVTEPDQVRFTDMLRIGSFGGSVRDLAVCSPLRTVWTGTAEGKIHIFSLRTLMQKFHPDSREHGSP
eukprot:ANDGO_04010.mRNA.1 Reticulocyte-binding protein 2 homolog a